MFSYMTRKTVCLLSLACFALLGLLSACSAPKEVEISEAKVRALLPGRDTTAGYFELRNHTAATLTLVGATSPAARAIEMHRTYIKDDRVGMQRIPEVTIAPGESVAFERGGLHLMIFGVNEFPEPFPITLRFADDRQVEAAFSKLAN